MPIPPRPIPTPTARRRPGTSVPRKSLPTSALDWRAEAALLADIPAARVGSVPTAGVVGKALHGIRLVERERGRDVGKKVGVKPEGDGEGGHGHEVMLEGLIAEGKGKREKRATTATSLGFDFVPNPSVLALPDTDEGVAGKTSKSKPSLLSTTKHSHAHSHVHSHAHSPRASSRPLTPTESDRGIPVAGNHLPSHLHLSASNPSLSLGRASPALSTTPSTPGLVPHSSIEDPDLSDWEHVDDFDEGRAKSRGNAAGAGGAGGAVGASHDMDHHEQHGQPQDEDDESDVGEVDSEGEEDVIVLGELELEDELQLVDRRKERRLEQMDKAKLDVGKKNVVNVVRSPVSYAAALGVKGALKL